MKIYFISDIHFACESAAKEANKRKLLQYFLEMATKDSNRLIIAGDLFDFWFEYKHVVMKDHMEVCNYLKEAVNKGLTIDYIAGNHDFWLGPYLQNEIGIKIHHDPTVLTIDNKRFYINHGDGIAKRDSAYRILKRILRNKLNIKLYRLLHPDFGIALAKFVSGSSRKYTNNIDLQDHDDYLEFAKEKMESEKADFVIMGHRHNPLRHEVQSKGIYLNLGDWLYHFSYAVYENGDMRLEYLKDIMDSFTQEQSNVS